MADTSVKVTFLGDAKDLNRAIEDVDGKMGAFSSKVGAKTKAAAVGGIAALGAGLFMAGEAAAEDEKAATSLAKTLENVTGATKDEVAQIEKMIRKTQLATGVMDDDLRPAFDSLVRSTGSTAKAQELLGLAMDVSAGTGKDLGSVTDALGKAYNGNAKAIKALAPELTGMIKDGASADEVFASLGSTFGGQMQAATETTAGKMAILKARLADSAEELGAKLIPVAVKFSDWLIVTAIPAIERLAGWIEEDLIPQLQDMWAWFDRNINPVLIRTYEIIRDIIEVIVKIGQFLAEATVKFWNFAIDVKEVVEDIIDAFKDVGEAIWAPFKWAFEKIKEIYDKSIGPIIDTINAVKGAFGGSVDEVRREELRKRGFSEEQIKAAGYAAGGMVPGPIGAPQLAIVHGGERVLTPAQQQGGGTTVIFELDGKVLARAMVNESNNSGGLPIRVRAAS